LFFSVKKAFQKTKVLVGRRRQNLTQKISKSTILTINKCSLCSKIGYPPTRPNTAEAQRGHSKGILASACIVIT
jgi:hypothetical protein